MKIVGNIEVVSNLNFCQEHAGLSIYFWYCNDRHCFEDVFLDNQYGVTPQSSCHLYFILFFQKIHQIIYKDITNRPAYNKHLKFFSYVAHL